MKAKKTIAIRQIIDESNRLLETSENGSVPLCLLLETILHRTGNYKGYNNVYWLDKGYELWVAAGKPENKDAFYGPEFQRRYY